MTSTENVDHGKSTLVEALTGKWPAVHSEELKRGITIRLGYADATFYKCPSCGTYLTFKKCPRCFADTKILRTVSFVDAPGHESLMATVLTGSALMDGAILVIAADEKCPLPQTREHLTTLEVVGVKNIVIVQNKIDLVTKKRAEKSYQEIKKFVEGTVAESSPIIPISAQQKINVEYLIEAIEDYIPTPKRDPEKNPKMLVARSFDINKPGSTPDKLVGGVIGGAIVQGKFKVGDRIEMRPGIRIGDKWKIITTEIVSMEKAGEKLEEAEAGGLLGVMTKLDPYFAKADGLVGNVIGLPEKLPPVRSQFKLRVKLLERAVGTEEMTEVRSLKPQEILMINIGTARSVGIVKSVRGSEAEIELKIPVCADKEDRVVISRQILGRWRLIGYGEIVD
ncbi:MAG: translation initiation factor IF-2 subunit gamma [Candidatus Aenigmarchaeota archaeon]|nr:translation initiation factor IF-2 subunit gamma [Candidatus Aenigmarchaeota archaeon]